MPSVSKKQRNFMAAAAHDPAFAKRVGISQKVAKEFNQADKGKKFGSGGMANTKDPRFAQKDYIAGGEGGGWAENDVTYGGKKVMQNVPEGYANELQREMGRAKTMQAVNAQPSERGPSKQALQDAADDRMRRLEEKAPTTRTEMGKKKGGKVSCGMKKGGSVRGCGIAQRGKTKGRMV